MMAVEIVTKEDLEAFRIKLIDEIKEVILSLEKPTEKRWLRSHEVKKLLQISTGTLQNLGISGTLRPVKIGGINFYKMEEIEAILNKP